MRRIKRRAFVCAVLALALLAGMGVFLGKFVMEGKAWASAPFNRHLYDSAGQLAAGTILDRDGDVLTEVKHGKRVYYDNETVRKATLHAVGDRNIGTGALLAFADRLSGYSLVNGAFEGSRGKSLQLTIDARYNYEAYQALEGRSGTVAVYNYRTGEILCMVSAPSYDPLHVPENLESDPRYEGAYLNRFLSATFPPGSVYKTVTLAAALEEIGDLERRTWTCEGTTVIGGETIVCSGTHGEQDIGTAFANSCNVVFAQLARELGKDTLRRYTDSAGLTQSVQVDGIPTAKGSFDWDSLSEGQLGWAGVGQANDRVNPCTLMLYMGAIANGGQTAQPRLLMKGGGLGALSEKLTLLSSGTAAKLAGFMMDNVEKTYGTGRFPNMTVGAKSGTAEVGEGQKPHAWFAGFLRQPDAPYAFVVLVENGGGGSAVAGSIAGRVLDVIVNGY